MTAQDGSLSAIVFTPLLVALTLLGAHVGLRRLGHSGLSTGLWRALGLAAALGTFGFVLGLWVAYDPTVTSFQFQHRVAWLPSWGIHWFVGLDGINLLLVLLTAFLMPLALLGSWSGHALERGFMFSMLALETCLLGAFSALNLVQFYAFCELTLIPMLFLVGVWGGSRRVHAALKLVLFTLLGSLPMLVAVLVLAFLQLDQIGGFNLDLVVAPGSASPSILHTLVPSGGEAPWWQTQHFLFVLFALAFAIRVPLVPLHTWLPDAHVEAPLGGSVVLAGVMLKLGAYGFVRLALPLFPVAAGDFAPAFLGLSLAGILAGSLIALVQRDLRRMFAYCSIAQLGFVMLGIFALGAEGLEGSVLQMVSHGVSTGALFLLAGMLADRRQTHEIAEFGGIAKPMPVFATALVVVAMSSVGLPMLCGFVGEFLILLGAFRAAPALACCAALGGVLAAAGMAGMLRRVLFGPVTTPDNRGLIDLGLREKAIVVAVFVPIVWIGVYPETFLRRLHPPVVELLRVMEERAVEIETALSMPPQHLVRVAASSEPVH